VLNARRNGAKCEAISIKIHCYGITRTFFNHRKASKKKVKKSANKYKFHRKKGQIGLMKFRVYNQTRKAKWCKMQVLFSKIDKTKDEQSESKELFTYFLTSFSAKMK